MALDYGAGIIVVFLFPSPHALEQQEQHVQQHYIRKLEVQGQPSVSIGVPW